MKVAIIGFGKVGYHLSKAFLNAGLSIHGIYNRSTISRPSFLPDSVKIYDELYAIPEDTEIAILSISDDQISDVAAQLGQNLKENAIIAHTSGIYGVQVFDESVKHKAAFYPLNSFSKAAEVDWKETPIFITSNNQEVEFKLTRLAKSISQKVYQVNDEQKEVLHTAAVFVNNFPNALFQMGYRMMENNNLEFESLMPLIKTTMEKVQNMTPEKAQTGPASRGDLQTIKKHYTILEDYPFEKQVYQLLTHYINPKLQDSHEND